jgi:hypothetical protein
MTLDTTIALTAIAVASPRNIRADEGLESIFWFGLLPYEQFTKNSRASETGQRNGIRTMSVGGGNAF